MKNIFVILILMMLMFGYQSQTGLTPLGNDPLEINFNARAGVLVENFGCEIVIVGSASGCVVGRRMLDAGYKVCILEAGGTNNYLEVYVPAFASLIYTNPYTDWMYVNNQPEFLALNYTMQLTSGKLWQGSFAHNSMVPSRGNNFDYNDWVKLGAKGWSWDEVLHYFKKIELYMAGGDVSHRYHNFKGIWPINKPAYTHDISYVIKNSIMSVLNVSEDADMNDGYPYGATIPAQNQMYGARVTPCDVLYTPDVLNSSNLYIKLNAEVIKVIFDTDNLTAIGVLYNDRLTGLNHTLYASKQVILSAGAYNTPKILMLSGIGPADHLTEMDIPVLVNRTGVGANLLDHILSGSSVANVTDTNITTFESFLPPFSDGSVATDLYFINGTGPFASPLGEVYANINSKIYNLNNNNCPAGGTYPFNKDGSPNTDPCAQISNMDIECAPVQFIKGGTISYYGTKGLSCGSNTHTASVGYVKLGCGDWRCSLNINHNYLNDLVQNNEAIDGIILSRRILNHTIFTATGKPNYEEITPGLQYQTRDELLLASRLYATEGFHYSGTARMGYRSDSLAVVDHRLRVIKDKNTLFKRLRVIDGSVMPKLPASNTMWIVLMIAEKGSAMLIDDLYYEN